MLKPLEIVVEIEFGGLGPRKNDSVALLSRHLFGFCIQHAKPIP